MDEATYKINTSVTPDGIITSQLVFHDNVEKHCQVMARWVVDTRDAHVHDGLVHLGWTPPANDGHKATS
jgi:hypothetical protein